MIALCPLISFAQPPLRSYVYGVLTGTSSATYYANKIYPINNMTFGIEPNVSDPIQACTQIQFYFRAEVDGFTSFHLRLRRLSTVYQDSTASLTSVNIYLREFNGTSFTNAVNIRSDVVGTKEIIGDYTEYDWLYSVETAVGHQNVIQVTIPFQTFAFGPGSVMYWEMLAFDVNGEVTQFDNSTNAVVDAINGLIDLLNEQFGTPPPIDDYISDFESGVSDTLSEVNNQASNLNSKIHSLLENGTLAGTTQTVFNPILNVFFGNYSGTFGICFAIIVISCFLCLVVYFLRRLG